MTWNVSIWTAAQFGDKSRIVEIGSRNPSSLAKFDSYGYTALHYASQNNFIDIVRYLLSQGVPVDANRCGATPLHRAAYAGRLEICKVLISHAADIFAIDTSIKPNIIPYQKAKQQGHTEVMDLLLIHMSEDRKIIDKLPPIESVNESFQLMIEYKSDQRNSDVPDSSKSLISDNGKMDDNLRAGDVTGTVCSKCHEASFSFSIIKSQLICLNCKYKKR